MEIAIKKYLGKENDEKPLSSLYFSDRELLENAIHYQQTKEVIVTFLKDYVRNDTFKYQTEELVDLRKIEQANKKDPQKTAEKLNGLNIKKNIGD